MRAKMMKYAEILMFVLLLFVVSGCEGNPVSDPSSYDNFGNTNNSWHNVYIQLEEKAIDAKQTVLAMIDDAWVKAEGRTGDQYTKLDNSIPDYGTYDMAYMVPKDEDETFVVRYYDEEDGAVAIGNVLFFDANANAKEYYDVYINGCEKNNPQQLIRVYLCGKSVVIFSPLSTMEHTPENRVVIEKLFEHFGRMMNIVLD